MLTQSRPSTLLHALRRLAGAVLLLGQVHAIAQSAPPPEAAAQDAGGAPQTVAQSAPPPEAAAAESGEGLQTVTVTARKREENVQNVPVAVTVVTPAQLERFDLTNLEAISAATPQLNVVRGSSGSGADLSLRGIGSTFTSIGIEQSVAVDVDGVYYGQGRIINEALFDMKDVEILKGPQALFFGKNASAGVVSVSTADPGKQFEAMARYGYEAKAEQSIAEAMVSGPVTDNFGLRLAVHYDHMWSGYVENQAQPQIFNTLDLATFTPGHHLSGAPVPNVPAQSDFAPRLTAKLTPTDDLTLTLKASTDEYKTRNATWNQIMVVCPLGHTQVNPSQNCNRDWKIQNNSVPGDIAATNPILGRHGGGLYQDYYSNEITGAAVYELPVVTLSSVNGYHRFTNFFLGDYDVTGAANGGTWGAERSDYGALSSELRAQTKFNGPLNGMLGAYYQNTQLNFNQDVLFPGGFSNSLAANPTDQYVTLEKLSRTDGKTNSGFAQLIYDVTKTLELTAGARYTHETKDSFFYQPYVNPAYRVAFVQTTRINANQSFNNWSPEAILTWKPESNLTFYGGYKQGFKSGGFSGSALYSVLTKPSYLSFNPEIPRGYEAGVKSSWLDDRLRANFDVFKYRYSNFQVDYFNSVQISFITKNVGEAVTEGAEAELQWAPAQVRGLTLIGALAFDLARYRQFVNAPCYGGQTPGEGCSIVGGQATQNLSGVPTQDSPRWVASLQANYSHPIGEKLEGGASGVVHVSSAMQVAPFGNPVDVQGGYGTLDLALHIGAESERWQVALIGKNLTNRFIVNYMQDAPSSGRGTGTAAGVHADQLGTPNLPRTVEVQVTARF